jgi:hypothetical protein
MKIVKSFRLFLLLFLILIGTFLNGQSNHTQEELKSMTFGQRLYYGGTVGATFGTVTSIQLMPVVGYRIMPRWSAGIGLTYQYFKDSRPLPAYETNIYGGNIHSRVFIWENLFAHTEFEVLNFDVPAFDLTSYRLVRKSVPAWFVGAGYFLPIGQRSGMSITILYDLIQDPNSPYPANYTMRIGFVL